jgi:hypothetical protein
MYNTDYYVQMLSFMHNNLALFRVQNNKTRSTQAPWSSYFIFKINILKFQKNREKILDVDIDDFYFLQKIQWEIFYILTM